MAACIYRSLAVCGAAAAVGAVLVVLSVAVEADDPVKQDTARIRAGDRLYVHSSAALPDHPVKGVYLVEPTGKLPLGPMYGRVQVSGLSVEEAEAIIRNQMGKTIRDPQLSVTWYDAASHGDPSLHDRIARLEKEVGELRAAVEKLGKR